MRPTSVKNLHRSAAKSKLPSTLHGKIRAQVSENPRHFIRQILSGGSCFTQMAHPQGSEIEIPQQKIETSGELLSQLLFHVLFLRGYLVILLNIWGKILQLTKLL